jgi:uncharacterized protein YidB (DUF937 family)
MTALLGLLAVAGYQNRDKIGEWLGKPGHRDSAARAGQGSFAGVIDQLRPNLGGVSSGSFLSGGLSELIGRFTQSGQGQTAHSWVGHGPNEPLTSSQLERAIGPDVLGNLAQQTGLSQQEILARLSRELPEAVDKYTPQGRIPAPPEEHA